MPVGSRQRNISFLLDPSKAVELQERKVTVSQLSAKAVDPVELLRRLRIGLCILSSDGQTHRMPLPNITPDHPLVCNILPNNSSSLSFYLQVSERFSASGLGEFGDTLPKHFYRC